MHYIMDLRERERREGQEVSDALQPGAPSADLQRRLFLPTKGKCPPSPRLNP